MADARYQPGKTIDEAGVSPKRTVICADATCGPGLLVIPSTGTYGNGVVVATANAGDSNIAEGKIESLEILANHPVSNTPYDKSTAFGSGASAIAIEHVVNQKYWLKGSSVTTAVGSKMIVAGSGLVKVALAHTATPLPLHTWIADRVYSAVTWFRGKYVGLVSSFTAV